MNICSPVRKHCAPFSDTGRVHNMFTIDRNKSSVNFTGSDVLRLQKPNHASHLTVGGSWYQRDHCLNLSHSQRGKVCSTNCTRQLSTLYWTHHMTHELKLNNCAGCIRKRSLLSRCPTYFRPKASVASLLTWLVVDSSMCSHFKITPSHFICLHCKTSVKSLLTWVSVGTIMYSLYHGQT